MNSIPTGQSGTIIGNAMMPAIYTNGSVNSIPSVSSIPLTARGLNGTKMVDDDYMATHQVLGVVGGDGPRPGYDPDDPFLTPVGDIPLLFMLVLCVMFVFKERSLKRVFRKG